MRRFLLYVAEEELACQLELAELMTGLYGEVLDPFRGDLARRLVFY